MKKGRKPSPTRKKELLGTLNPSREKKRTAEPAATGKPYKPKALTADAGVIWDECAGLLPWLRAVDSRTFAIWCELSAQFDRAPDDMSASRLTQLRAFGELLGVSPSARARLGETIAGVPPPRVAKEAKIEGQSEEASGYFKD